MSWLSSGNQPPLWLVGVFLLGLVLAISQMCNTSLNIDDLDPLSIATGHANIYGEYNLPDHFLTARYYKQLCEFPGPGLNIGEVIDALKRSWTVPPLYPVLLSLWLRLWGTSDMALRSFALPWFVACFPFVWLIARRAGGRTAAMLSTAFLAIHPTGIHFASDAHPYMMCMFFATALVWLTIQCQDKGFSPGRFCGLSLLAAGALYTSYFCTPFVFGCWFWLWIKPGKFSRRLVFLHCVLVALAMLPWFVQTQSLLHKHDESEPHTWYMVPVSFAFAISTVSRYLFWQVAPHGLADYDSWETGPSIYCAIPLAVLWAAMLIKIPWLPSKREAKGLALILTPAVAVSFLSLRIPDALPAIAIGLYFISVLCMKVPNISSHRKQTVSFIYLALLLGIAPPFIAYLVVKTNILAPHRYYVMGLIPYLILLALASQKLQLPFRQVVLGSLAAVWLTSSIFLSTFVHSRMGQDFARMARIINQQNQDWGIVVDGALPTGFGLSRRLPDQRKMLCWYGNLDRPLSPMDIARIVENYPGVLLVKEDSAPQYMSPYQRWLFKNGRVQWSQYVGPYWITAFVPANGKFFQSASTQEAP